MTSHPIRVLNLRAVNLKGGGQMQDHDSFCILKEVLY